jgi:hypothetical protein
MGPTWLTIACCPIGRPWPQRSGRAPGGRPDRGDAAEGRGNAQRAADVVAEAERRSAGGDQRRFAAPAAAAGSFHIPRIVGAAVERIVAFGVDEQLRDVGLGDRDRAGGPQRRDIGVVLGFHHRAARRQSERRCGAGEIEAFLDGDRQTGQWSKLLAAQQRVVELRGGLARAVEQLDGDRVEPGVDGFEPCNEVLHDLGGRDVARGDARRNLPSRHVLQRKQARNRHGDGAIGERHGGPPSRLARARGEPG